MATTKKNLLILKKTRRKPDQGDIFVFQLESLPDRYFFGRVVATDTTIGGITDIGVILIYLYRISSQDKKAIPDLQISDLLTPPIGTNAMPWTKGYFEVVHSGENSPDDLLTQHCFYSPFRKCYFDEYGNSLPTKVEPVGMYGLSGLGSIDNEISKALGIPTVATN